MAPRGRRAWHVRYRDDALTWETLPLFRTGVWLTSDNKARRPNGKGNAREKSPVGQLFQRGLTPPRFDKLYIIIKKPWRPVLSVILGILQCYTMTQGIVPGSYPNTIGKYPDNLNVIRI